MQKEIEKLEKGEEPATAKRYKEMRKEHSDWRSDLSFFTEEDCGCDGPIKPKKGIKNKITINPDLKSEEVTTGPVMKPGSGLGGGKLAYPKGQEPKATGAKLPSLQQAHYEPEGEQLDEVTPPGAKYERMVKHIKKGYSDGGLSKKEKSIAYATAWKQYNKSKNEEFAGNYEGPLYAPHPDLVEKKDDSYLETNMKKREENNKKAIADMKKTKAHSDMVKAARKHFEEIEAELDYYLDEALRPASERMKRTQTAAGRKKQEQEREKKSKLESEADKILAGFSNKGTGTAKTKATPKASAPEANRSLKAGQKKDTLAVKASKSMKEDLVTEREMDEPGERNSRPDVKLHNKRVGYKERPRRPRIEDDPRYGTVQDKSGKWKY